MLSDEKVLALRGFSTETLKEMQEIINDEIDKREYGIAMAEVEEIFEKLKSMENNKILKDHKFRVGPTIIDFHDIQMFFYDVLD